ncbi:MAG: DoxX family protein [Gemmataceae bacterium]|nr:DoxX family protein [Gemmata sp.]MDW8198972.1 DoxX family protein [Gemmataceae bacterium]
MNWTQLPLPLTVIYAGLAGTVLALMVATITNGWSMRVFFLLSLRLAIGWHFLFEGLHKVQSHYLGPTETSKPFSSEPYFRTATGPLGPILRQQFADPLADIDAKVKAPKPLTATQFRQLTLEQQAAECPPAVAALLDPLEGKAAEAVAAMKAAAEKDAAAAAAQEKKALQEIDTWEAQALQGAETDFQKKQIQRQAAEARDEARWKAKTARDAAQRKKEQYTDGRHLFLATKATYARWVYGVDRRDCTLKAISGEVAMSAPERLRHLDWLRDQLQAAEAAAAADLGNGYGIDVKRRAEWRADLIAAELDLARDANAFIAELQKVLNNGQAVEQPVPTARGEWLDRITMWFLVGVGACLMAGLFTRLACLAATGFLVTTYLVHPPFPWYPLPPGTEGNPLFINKNVIEALALLTVASFPTGRWLGLDAIVLRPFRRSAPSAA